SGGHDERQERAVPDVPGAGVRAVTPEERARQVVIALTGLPPDEDDSAEVNYLDAMANQIRAAIAEEREACASLATEFCVGVHEGECPACDVASAIRAR